MVKEDVKRGAGSLQVCTGQQAGGETAIHVMRKIFGQDECETVLLVDAKKNITHFKQKDNASQRSRKVSLTCDIC